MLTEKAKRIKLLICDIDGILTDGIIYYGNAENNLFETKGFHIHDGLGIKLLQAAEINFAVISGKTSPSLKHRLKELKIKHTYLGNDKKLSSYLELKNIFNLTDKEIAFMGDDLPDLPILKLVGLAITVPEAPTIIQQHATLVTKKSAGKGAVREICDFLIESQGKTQTVLDNYLST